MNETLEIDDSEELPEWVVAALNRALNRPSAPSVLDHREGVAWPMLVEASLVSSFLPRDLAPELPDGEQRLEAEKAVLRFAETTYGPSGTQWTLTTQSRCQVVEAAIGTGELEQAVEHTSSRFSDNISYAMRTCVARSSESVPEVDLRSLEALRIAVSTLVGVSRERLKLPPLDKLDREIALRRLLRQFERMVGRKADDDADKQDRFFGREAELKQLRDYVGVIRAESKLGAVIRNIENVSRKFKERGPLAVWGVGGAGKTTLISKFMLEHAEAAASRFPFAYLDFERTTVGARQRLDLLAEMCVQVGAQFEQLTAPLAELRAEVLKLARDLEFNNQTETISDYSTYCLKFRDLVDGMLESLESKFEWARPFLLVFDTFEVVQYAQGDAEAQDTVRGLEEFVRCFSRPDEDKTWPRLRLIISGRTQVKKFLGDVEECPVGALDPAGSAQLLVALARDAKRPITDREATTLVEVVAKVIREPNQGVQPLRLHLIGEVFRTSTGGGKLVVESLLDELSQPLESHRVAAKIWIDGILVRRILGHVRDDRVRALADPGLVVRRITPEVIQKVMTQGTSKPAGKEAEAEDADLDITDPWIIDDSEAQNIFESFGREITLVENDNDGLRHRPDVRQQMLPLIRARRPKRFKLLNKLAFDYFSKRALEDPKDLNAAGEAIYHGLWLDEPLETLNSFWRDAAAFRPRIDPADFDGGSLANIYVRAKARAPLTADEVRRLPSEVALEWLDARSPDLLDDHRVDDAIEAIRAAAGPDYAGLDNRTGTAAVLARLLYRAGLWQDTVDLALRHIKAAREDELVGPDEQPSNHEKAARQEALLSLVRTLATIIGKSRGAPEALEKLSKIAGSFRDAMIRVEIAAHIIVGCSQHGENWQSLRREVAERVLLPSVPAIDADRWRKDKKVLRLAILCDDDDVKGDAAKAFPELLPLWIAANERVPRDIDHTLLGYLLSQIFSDGPVALDAEEILAGLNSPKTRRGAMNRLDELWRKEKSTIQTAVRSRADLKPLMRGVVAADNSDWVRPFGNSLTRALRDAGGAALATSLEKAHFRISSTRRDRSQHADGIAAVQYAMDDGRLLQLAESVGRWHEKNKTRPTTEVQTYPQDVFAIANALVHWHASLNRGDQGLSWEDAPQLESRLKRELDAFDWHGAAEICNEIVDRMKKIQDKIPETTAKRLLTSLRRKRRFMLMRQLADAIIKSGVRTPQVRRQYAQALIDEGHFEEAEHILNSIIQDPMGIAGEVVEARGLIGRIYKQRYVNNSNAPAEENAVNLRRALELYYEVYRLNPAENLWHGINVVALAARARRDGVSFEEIPDELALAREILATIAAREEQWTVALYAYDEATRMEAHVALGHYRDADESALRYVESIDADAFELNSTIRQLTEVWQLNYNEAPGNTLLPILKAAHLSKEGGFYERQPEKLAEESRAVGLAVKDLEARFGTARTVTLKWYKRGLEVCNSIARIETPDGRGVATGWLVKASDFFPDREGVLLLTNEHVISSEPKHPAKAILPANAQANFQAMNEVLQFKEIVWSSSYKDLDATFVTLEREPKAPPLELHELAVEMPQPPEPAPRLYIIGHPEGNDIEFSIQDNHLLGTNEKVLHYRTPTANGSSGSPVFESQRWRVVALHHGVSATVVSIGNGKRTHEANEGIAIRAISAQTRSGSTAA